MQAVDHKTSDELLKEILVAKIVDKFLPAVESVAAGDGITLDGVVLTGGSARNTAANYAVAEALSLQGWRHIRIFVPPSPGESG